MQNPEKKELKKEKEKAEQERESVQEEERDSKMLYEPFDEDEVGHLNRRPSKMFLVIFFFYFSIIFSVILVGALCEFSVGHGFWLSWGPMECGTQTTRVCPSKHTCTLLLLN